MHARETWQKWVWKRTTQQTVHQGGEDKQLYQRPQMTGQARDAEEEEEDINIIIHHSTMNTNDSFNSKLIHTLQLFLWCVELVYALSQAFNRAFFNWCELAHRHVMSGHLWIVYTSKEPVCPRVELILKIIIILLIIFLGFIKSKPC